LIKQENRLTHIRRITPRGTRLHKGLFLCSCGKEIVAFEGNVRRNHTRSCGCLNREIKRNGKPLTHGHWIKGKPSKTYVSWQAMIARCTNENHPAFQHYAGKGITICDAWLYSFIAFLADMGERPEGKTLDRMNNSKGYFKENCRWATPKEQSLNSSNVAKRFDFRGNLLTLGEIKKISGSSINIKTIKSRLRCGWLIEKAITILPWSMKPTALQEK